MTKRDYIVLAGALKRNTRLDYSVGINKPPNVVIDRDDFLLELCDILQADNPRFDEVKFRNACQ